MLDLEIIAVPISQLPQLLDHFDCKASLILFHKPHVHLIQETFDLARLLLLQRIRLDPICQ